MVALNFKFAQLFVFFYSVGFKKTWVGSFFFLKKEKK